MVLTLADGFEIKMPESLSGMFAALRMTAFVRALVIEIKLIGGDHIMYMIWWLVIGAVIGAALKLALPAKFSGGIVLMAIMGAIGSFVFRFLASSFIAAITGLTGPIGGIIVSVIGVLAVIAFYEFFIAK